eukprot:3381573-Pyramimonas_sp.AAC.1
MKVWSKCRQALCKKWEVEHPAAVVWGAGPDTTCERTGWVHNMLAHFGHCIGTASATALLDRKKFYEHITHSDLYAAVVEHKFNLKLFRGLCTVYDADRVLHCGGRVSQALRANGGVIAGCSAATTLSRLLLLKPLTLAQFSRPQLAVRSVIDDIALQIVAPPSVV